MEIYTVLSPFVERYNLYCYDNTDFPLPFIHWNFWYMLPARYWIYLFNRIWLAPKSQFIFWYAGLHIINSLYIGFSVKYDTHFSEIVRLGIYNTSSKIIKKSNINHYHNYLSYFSWSAFMAAYEIFRPLFFHFRLVFLKQINWKIPP